MSEIIVITSGKGGVGKTTTTANLGIQLSKLGKKVLLIDADVGLRNLDISLGLENSIVYDFVDVIAGICELDKAIIKDKSTEGLFFLPAAQIKSDDCVTSEQMKNLCSELKNMFDFVLIDCPTGIGQGFRNATAGADKALIVTAPEIAAVRDADRIISLLEKQGLSEMSVIINRVRPKMIRRGEMMSIADIMNTLKIDLIGVVPEDEEVIKAAMRKHSVVLQPKSVAGQCYMKIAERLCGINVPIKNFDGKRKSL